MHFDPIYALQRRTIARKMHAQVNKLYLHEKKHPYLKSLHDLRPQYVYRIREIHDLLQEALRTKVLSNDVLHLVLFEFATNPCAQVKVKYAEILDIKNLLADYARGVGSMEEYASTLYTATERLLAHIPDVIPTPETATAQLTEMREFVEWYQDWCDYTVQDIIKYTDSHYLQNIMYSFRNCVHPKAPHMQDYAMNIDAIIYSSLRLLCKQPYAKDEAHIVFWCCMYLRYCAPGFLDAGHMNKDAYAKTMNVLNILHNEWQYLQAKYQ